MLANPRWWIFAIGSAVVVLLAVFNLVAGNRTTGIILILLAVTLGVRSFLKLRGR
jgi:hypothetical protein